MQQLEVPEFFQCLGEIWRDITLIEFLMRCCIAKYDGESDRFPKGPYEKGKIYGNPPDAFLHYSFERVVEKFNKRFPKLALPSELVALRDALAHGLIASVDHQPEQLIKFKETKNISGAKELTTEFSLRLDMQTLRQMRQSLMEIRTWLSKEITE